MHADGPATLSTRDRRIDFFRGLALIFIFIDHIPDNTWAHYTLKNFGFADASEVFVLLSGYSVALAYGLGAGHPPLAASARRALKRALEIYCWHIGIFAVSAALLFTAASVFERPAYVTNIWLENLASEPLAWSFYALTLTYQPNQMNILPLYVVLMLWVPVALALLRRSVLLALAVSVATWLLANVFEINLRANTGEGWFFNPFAWQLLFTTGMAAVVLSRRHEIRGRGAALAIAGLYVAFSFFYASPWAPASWGAQAPLLPPDLVGPVSKADLSGWRFLHVLALAYIAGSLVTPVSAWLDSPLARAVALCGRYAIEMFALGTLLSFAGWIVLWELGTSSGRELAVTVTGIALMITAAQGLGARRLRAIPA